MTPVRIALAAALLLAALPAAAALHTPALEREHIAEVTMTSPDLSLAERIARDPAKFEAFRASLSEDEAAELEFLWSFFARPKQLAPTHREWQYWLVLAGRGFGKTRTGAEWVRGHAESGKVRRLTLIGPTSDDVRDAMIEGESGILAISPKDFRPRYQPSKRRLTWPNGARALLLTADEPDRARGKQHEKVWADELAAWRYPDAWDQTMLGLRLGDSPQACVTTTPRPTALIKDLMKDPGTVVTTGSTYENKGNLARAFLSKVITKYEGTRLGRQELEAEILEDTPGALWRIAQLDALRVRSLPLEMRRIVVAVDPSVADDGGGDECGIVVAGVGNCSCKGPGNEEEHAFVFDDLSGALSPGEWADRVVNAYKTHGADRIVAEVNNGGGLVEVNVRTVDKDAAYKAVHASRGKRSRAEPVAALYEQKKVHHVGALAKLESEMTTWDASSGAKSPNRLDAVVWALTDLVVGEGFFFV